MKNCGRRDKDLRVFPFPRSRSLNVVNGSSKRSAERDAMEHPVVRAIPETARPQLLAIVATPDEGTRKRTLKANVPPFLSLSLSLSLVRPAVELLRKRRNVCTLACSKVQGFSFPFFFFFFFFF